MAEKQYVSLEAAKLLKENRLVVVEESYVSFEIAKLLKEKGFDGICYACYEYFSSSITMYSGWPFEYKGEVVHNSDNRIICPTKAMVMSWLRKVHKIFIEIGTSIDLNGNYHFSYTILDKECKYIIKGCSSFDWTYEQTVDAAIRYSLENLI